MKNRTAVSRNEITEGVIWKQLLIFFFPILFGTFFQQLYNTADAVIVGRFIGKEALAAVGGPTGTIINLLVNLFVGISSGAGVVIAQFYGANRKDDVRKTVHTSMALVIVIGAFMTVFGILIAPWSLRAMGTPSDIMEYAVTYMRVYFAGIIGSFLYNIGSGILRAIGDTKRPLIFLIISCLINIALDLLFVAVFHMGVFGAALATILSQFVSAVLVVITLLRTKDCYRLIPKEIRFHRGILGGILKVGLPAGFQSNMYAISNILIQSCINSFGTDTIAAWTAYGKIDGFFWMIMGAFGISVTTFASQNFGAGRYDRIHKSVRTCLAMSFGTSIGVSVLFFCFSGPLLSLFTSDAAVLENGLAIMRFMVPYYFTYICIEILSGAIRGTGDSLIPMLITGGGVCVLRILWIFFALPLNRSFEMVMASYPITWVITSILFIIYYKKGKWLTKRMIASGYTPK